MLAALAVLVLVGAGLAAGLLFLTSRDRSTLKATEGPGTLFADQGARHLRPGQDAGAVYNSAPPTSGPHVPVLPRSDGRPIDDDALLHALELGNVVLAYSGAQPPAPLRALQRELSGPFVSELAGAGQAVILARREDVEGSVALAWRRRQGAPSARDPALREFAEFWLGRGRGG